MAIKGSLSEASLPDVIQLLTYSNKSGCLSVTDGRNFANIFIKDGKIIYATMLNRKQRLGNILLTKKIIDSETLTQALKIQKSEKTKRLGEILIEIGVISEEVLKKELMGQIEQTIFNMLTWESGHFNFETDLLPPPEEYTIQLSAQELLLEGARRIDEWRQIENKIPPFETVLVRKGDTKDVPLTTEEQKILELIDGSHTIDDVLKLSKFGFFGTSRVIYGLLSAGLLAEPEKKLESKKTTGDISECKNLGFAFYKTGMYNEAEREYNKVLEVNGNDTEALFYSGLIQLARGHHDAARINLLRSYGQDRRVSVLTNLGYVCLKLGFNEEAIEYLEQAEGLASDNMKIKCNMGIAFYKMVNLDKASKIFKEIIVKSPEIITPYIYLPIIYLKQGNSEESASLLNDAIDRFPRLAVFKNNLAVLYENIDKAEEAEKLYRQALETTPRDELICRNLADFYYEAQILGAAKELYEKISIDKRDWQILFRLGNIHLRQGDQDKALHLWVQARDLNPSERTITQNIELLQKSDGK